MIIAHTRDSFFNFIREAQGVRNVAAVMDLVDREISQGNRAAIYRNTDMSHPQRGNTKVMIWAAEVKPPMTLPDDFRYELEGIYEETTLAVQRY